MTGGLLMKRNSFLVEIDSCQHESWQGSIRWMEGNKKEYFRSALELIKLMDSTIETEKSSLNTEDTLK